MRQSLHRQAVLGNTWAQRAIEGIQLHLGPLLQLHIASAYPVPAAVAGDIAVCMQLKNVASNYPVAERKSQIAVMRAQVYLLHAASATAIKPRGRLWILEKAYTNNPSVVLSNAGTLFLTHAEPCSHIKTHIDMSVLSLVRMRVYLRCMALSTVSGCGMHQQQEQQQLAALQFLRGNASPTITQSCLVGHHRMAVYLGSSCPSSQGCCYQSDMKRHPQILLQRLEFCTDHWHEHFQRAYIGLGNGREICLQRLLLMLQLIVLPAPTGNHHLMQEPGDGIGCNPSLRNRRMYRLCNQELHFLQE